MSKLQIVFEHSDFLIINKPANLSFHNDKEEIGCFNQIKNQLGIDLWPVHRLDKMTSGLLIVAKSKLAATQLGQMFEQHEINKTYLAISDKKPKKKQGRVSGDMKKSRSGSWKLCHSKNNPANTYFKSLSIQAGIRLFQVTPMTGKTHQIRVALKSLGSPILGDSRYGGTDSDRGYLHAFKLMFDWKSESINIQNFPDDGKYFLEAFPSDNH